MRLLHARTLQLHTFAYPPSVPYAIFSHTWSSPHDDEWSYYGSEGPEKDSTRHEIILRVCNLTQEHSLEFVWIDDVCIDKSSTTDVSKAINSLPKYFQQAAICFAFLVDLPCGTSVPCKDTWGQCQFWTRAWTLQELILPAKIQFYDSKWHLRGERSSQHLHSLISGITGIDEEILSRQRTLEQTSVARKMSWAAWRTSSSPEDIAYSLLGLFDVYIPIVFGEGSRRAFRRLQEEILKHSNDASLFAWTSREEERYRGIFANSPQEFLAFAQPDMSHLPFDFKGFVVLVSKGVLVSGQFSIQQDGLLLDLGSQAGSKDKSNRHGLLFRRSHNGTFGRIMFGEIQTLAATEKTTAMQVMVFRGHVDQADANSHEVYFAAYKGGGLSAAPCTSASSVCSFEPPCTLNRETSAEQRTSSTVTPTGSNPNIAQRPHRDEPEWIKVHESSAEETILDESDEDCASMQVSQQTDIDWPRPESAMSNVTTVTSPSNTEPEFAPHDYQQAGRGLKEHQYCPLTTQRNSKAEVLDHHEDMKEHLSNFLLDHFADSRLVDGRLHKQRIKRSRITKRQFTKRQLRNRGPAQHLSFACPFYKRQPQMHVDCVASCEFNNMADVRDHLWQHHRLPYYCPICKTQFRYSSEKDGHIIQRSCEYRDCMPYEGISEDQYRSIFQTQETSNNMVEWFMVWDILFPTISPPKDPYLRDQRARDMSEFRTFWHQRGQRLLGDRISNFLSPNSLPDPQEVEKLSSGIYTQTVKALARGSVHRSNIRSSTETLSTHTMWAKTDI